MIESSTVERFRALVQERSGLSFAANKADELMQLLRQRAVARGTGVLEYVARLERGETLGELRELAPFLTVGETYFFRHAAQIDAFRAIAYQHMTQPESSGRPLRVLSAGCASGEEAYSLAIAAREVFGNTSGAAVVGVDINPRALERARRARYSEWSLRSVSEDVRARWFRQSGAEVLLDPAIHAAVTFVEGNLVQCDRELFGNGRWDVIYCRNVLMYFSPDKARAALDNFTRALTGQGHLFLGHAETLRGLSHDYHLRHTHDAFYYQRKPGDSARPSQPPSPAELAVAPELELPSMGEDWFTSISRATARVRDLGFPGAASREHLQPMAASGDLGQVLELMQSDRHSEAFALFSRGAAAQSDDPDRLLVEATLLTHANRFPAAEAVCARLLLLDELNSGAHYVLALCREAAGDLERAMYHDQVAAYLDPGFAMPHVHMGLMLRRSGKCEASRHELSQAHALLEREDTARVAMFGGGFNRSALRALCLTELAPGAGGSA
jgi:chemotaxis protein methyltransferase CheR